VASISALAAAAIFCASLCVAAEALHFRQPLPFRPTRGALQTSFCRFASLLSASRSCASAAALALVASVIAELTASALFRNTGGKQFAKTHTITPARIAKLIHLKISVARSVAACHLPQSIRPNDCERNTNRNSQPGKGDDFVSSSFSRGSAGRGGACRMRLAISAESCATVASTSRRATASSAATRASPR